MFCGHYIFNMDLFSYMQCPSVNVPCKSFVIFHINTVYKVDYGLGFFGFCLGFPEISL